MASFDAPDQLSIRAKGLTNGSMHHSIPLGEPIVLENI
jgi:hypothetical protein